MTIQSVEVLTDVIEDVLSRALDRIRRVEAALAANSAEVHELAVARRLIESAVNVARSQATAAQEGDARYDATGGEFQLAPQPLTAREEEVLQLMARGLRNKDIAQALNVSERTAIFHVGNVIAKLGADSRSEAVHLARKHRLIE